MEAAECSLSKLSTLETGMNMVFLFEEMKGNSQIRSFCSTLMTRIANLSANYSKTLFDNDVSKLSEEVQIFKNRL